MLFAHRRTLSENSISTSCSKSPRSWTKVEVQTRRSRQSLSQRGAATSYILKALMRNIRRRARKTNNVSCGGSSKSGINRYKNAGRLFIFMWNRLLGKKKTNQTSWTWLQFWARVPVCALKCPLWNTAVMLTFYYRPFQGSCLCMKLCLTLFTDLLLCTFWLHVLCNGMFTYVYIFQQQSAGNLNKNKNTCVFQDVGPLFSFIMTSLF